MGKLHLVLVVVVLLIFNYPTNAKSLGNFKSYRQLTDKEILIESTKGSFILVSAYNDYAVGISVVNVNEKLELTNPKVIHLNSELTGSIYVEELDELMQITTTIDDGLAIRIEKKPLRFTYIDKTSNEVLFEESNSVIFGNKSNNITFSVTEDEEIKLFSNNKIQTFSTNINKGEVFSSDQLNELKNQDNEICMVSSKGYTVIFESELSHNIDYSKSEKLKISTIGEGNNYFSYLLIYGPQQAELIEKYAFHLTPVNKEISLNQPAISTY